MNSPKKSLDFYPFLTRFLPVSINGEGQVLEYLE